MDYEQFEKEILMSHIEHQKQCQNTQDIAKVSDDALIALLVPQVIKIAKSYANTIMPFDDLFQEGILALISLLKTSENGYQSYKIQHIIRNIKKSLVSLIKSEFNISKKTINCFRGRATETTDLVIDSKYIDLENTVAGNDLHNIFENIFETLTLREVTILKLRYGFNNEDPKTLEETGKQCHLTKERIRQIEAKALRKLRHPNRAKKLKGYILSQEYNEYNHRYRYSNVSFVDDIINKYIKEHWRRYKKEQLSKVYISQLNLPIKTYTYLKKHNFNTLSELSQCFERAVIDSKMINCSTFNELFYRLYKSNLDIECIRHIAKIKDINLDVFQPQEFNGSNDGKLYIYFNIKNNTAKTMKIYLKKCSLYKENKNSQYDQFLEGYPPSEELIFPDETRTFVVIWFVYRWCNKELRNDDTLVITLQETKYGYTYYYNFSYCNTNEGNCWKLKNYGEEK